MKARSWLLPLLFLGFLLPKTARTQPPDQLMERARRITQERPDSARELLRKAQDSIREDRNPECLSELYYTYGMLYFFQQDMDSSIKYFRRGVELAQRQGYETDVMNFTALLGTAYKNAQQYVEAARYLKAAIRMARQRGDSRSLGGTLINLSSLFMDLKAHESCMPYLQEALRIYEASGDSLNLAIVHFNLGNALLPTKPDSALKHFQAGLDLSRSIGKDLRIGEAQWGMGRALRELNRYPEAKRQFHAAIHKLDPLPFERHFVHAAWIELMLIHEEENHRDSAAHYASLLERVVQKTEHAEVKTVALRKLGRLYRRSGQLDKAASYLDAYVRVSDSVHQMQQRAFAQIIDMSSEEVRQELQGKLTKQELAQQQERRVAHGIGTFVLIALLVISFAVILRIKFLKKRLRRAYRQETRLTADLQASNDRLREALTQIKEANRLRDLLTSAIVHDLKNPLNSIIGLAQLPLSEQTRLMIQRSGKKMLGQVHDLLDLQRLEQAKMELKIEDCPALLALQDALAEVEYEARARGVRLEAVSPQDLVAPCDANLIHRVLVNLLTNALKFSPREAAVQAGAERRGQFLHFWVADQGPGVPEHLREMIFERFTQAEATSQTTARSSGLGLAFCKLAVEAHGGRILVERGVLGGACFSFYLPSVPQERPAKTERTETSA